MRNRTKHRTLIAILLSVAMLITGVPAASFAAGGSGPALTVGQVTSEGGTNVEVPLQLEGNSGICGATITVSYDEKLTLAAVNRGEALTGLDMTKPGNLAVNPVKILWSGTDEDSSNGVIAVLTFTVPKTAGTYPVQVSYEPGEVMDGDLNEVDLKITNGSITIEDPRANDREAAAFAEAAIAAMDPADEDSVAAARAAYDALTPAQKEMVGEDSLKKLTDAEAAIEQKKEQQEADRRAVDAVERAIKSINPGDRDSVAAARAAYDALDNELKAQIDAELLTRLTAAEEVVRQEDEKQAANQSKADEVADQISAMDPEDEASVAAARTAYQNLTDAQKALVSADVLKKLTDAENALKDQESRREEDQNAADAVIDQINAMDPADAQSVDAAREAYAALTEDQKKLVTNLSQLESAEAGLSAGRIDLNTMSFGRITDRTYDGYGEYPGAYAIFLTTDDPWVLFEDVDYEASYENNFNAGTAKVILKGIGKYKGTKELSFKINPLNMTAWDESFCLSNTSYTYDAMSIS